MRKKITREELKKVLDDHKLWIDNHSEGKRADLAYTDLSGMDLRGVDLFAADLFRASLENTDLRGAYMAGCTLEGANLKGANLISTDLEAANLGVTVLTDVKISESTNLAGVTGLERAEISFHGLGYVGEKMRVLKLLGEYVYFYNGEEFSERRLREHIEGSHEDLKDSLIFALETLKKALAFEEHSR